MMLVLLSTSSCGKYASRVEQMVHSSFQLASPLQKLACYWITQCYLPSSRRHISAVSSRAKLVLGIANLEGCKAELYIGDWAHYLLYALVECLCVWQGHCQCHTTSVRLCQQRLPVHQWHPSQTGPWFCCINRTAVCLSLSGIGRLMLDMT